MALRRSRQPGWRSVPTRQHMPRVVRAPLRMAMISYAYSYVIDALNAAALNAEARAPMCESWDVRAQPAESEWLAMVVVLRVTAHRSTRSGWTG